MTSGDTSTSNHHGTSGSYVAADGDLTLRPPLPAGRGGGRARAAARWARWAWGRRASGRLLARRALRRVGPAVALCVMLLSGLLGQLAAAGIGLGRTPVAYAAGMGSRPGVAQGKPNAVNPRLGATSIIHPWQAPPVTNAGQPAAPTPRIGRGLNTAGSVALPMKPGSVALSPTAAARFAGSDGVLTVTVPAGAVTAADEAAAGGKLTLLVSQVAPASGSSAGGSGHISLGMYLLQLVDASGRRVTHGLRKAITLTLHDGPKGIGGDPVAGAFEFNLPLPHGAAVAPAPAPAASTGSAGAAGAVAGTPAGALLGAASQQKASVDLGAHTLSTTVQPATAELSASFNTDAPVASFGGPDPYSVDLNAGGLTATYPLDVPRGPGGLTPPLQLTYSSASVSEQHNPQAAASWVGEGWNLSLGSISWSEHQVSTGIWESEWKLNDRYGTSADLIPPDLTVSSYWDDTVNYPCDTGTTGITPTHTCPVQFQTSPETHAKVVMYSNPLSGADTWLPDGAGAQPPCWRVFLPNGIMEEFGCTQDALQYYFVPGIGDEIANWYLDLISDPEGNQIHVHYTQDVESKQFSDGTHTFVRDVVLSDVEYDSPTCLQNATVYADNYCNGTAAPTLWKPLMRVQFNAAHGVQNTYGSSCAANGNLRCDDPVDYPNGLSAPLVQSVWVLNSATVQLWQTVNGTANWQTLRTYTFWYDQGGSGSIPDPVTGEGEGVAGLLLLTRIQETGSDETTTLPPVTLVYTEQHEHYVDSSTISPPPSPQAGCGYSWNTPCNLWSQSYSGNSWYLATMDNGLGLEETYSWAEAHDNTHGVNSGSAANPLACTPGTDGNIGGYPCDEADDQGWSRMVLTQRASTVLEEWGGGISPLTSTTAYHYLLTTFATNTQLCGDCTASMYWGSQNDVDYLDFYNGRFMGFAEADVNQADGSVQKYHFDTTTGWGVYDTEQVPCGTTPPRQPSGQPPCHAAPWWNIAVAGHGRAYEVDAYDTNGTTLLAKTTTGYTLTCPPSGVAATPTHYWDGIHTGSFDNMNVAMVDLNNPVATCEIHATQTGSYLYDGSGGSAVHGTTTAGYDSYGRLAWTIANSNGGGGALGSPTQIETAYQYIWNDAVTQYPHSATGTYLVDRLADAVVEDSSAQPTHDRCAFVAYDGHSGAISGQQSSLTKGLATQSYRYTACGTYANGYAASGLIETTAVYDSYGNLIAGDDADTNVGYANNTGCLPGSGSTDYTSCTLYDPTFETLPTASANALAQTISLTYGDPADAALGGYGLWPTSASDPNQQVTSTTYDALGRTTSVTLPGETSGDATSSTTYTTWCVQGTAGVNGGVVGNGQAPCVEVDTTQRLDSGPGHTVTSRAFYDGLGRLVETRAPAPGAGGSGNDVVAFVAYDIMGRPMQQSVAFQVAAYTGAPGAAAFFPFPTSGVAVSQTFYDGLGRVGETVDPQSNKTQYFRGPVCGAFDDSACYESVLRVDPLAHEQQTLTDAFGRPAYSIAFSGNGTSGDPYAYAAVTRQTYDYDGNLTKVLEPDGSHTLTYSYDDTGRVTAMSDPDRGSESYGYDPNGNLAQSVDARGTSGTVYLGYDQLNRPLWRNSSNSPTGAYVTYHYDSTAGGSYGIGHLSSEQFNTGKSLGVGSYSYTYDARGQTVGLSEVVDGSTYPFSFGYNDAGQPTSVGYSDGTYLCDSYDGASGALSSVALTAAGTSSSTGCAARGQTTLASGLAYGGDAGAAGLVTGASLNTGNGTTYSYAASYDDDLRLLSSAVTLTTGGATLYQVQPGYDAASNVTAVDTTLGTGTSTSTDTQSFCYDDLGRLIWASSATGNGPTNPATGQPCASNTAGSLTGQGALYTASYAYDNLDRLTSGPADGGSSYTYGDAAHLHAATSTSGGYSATYDAAGNMTCRAPTAAATCTGSTPTGAVLSYDNEGQLTGWTSALNGAPTPNTAAFAYDGEGSRVAMQSTSGGVTSITDYLLGGLEEVANSGGTSTLTEYYPLPGIGTAVRVSSGSSSTLSYLASDGLGSVTVALSTTGSVTAQQLYSPYGTVRYSSGQMPTAHGYTGQLADALTGLSYYGARYYDPALGQFTSADTAIEGGLDRYAYVGDSPCTYNDPSGHCEKKPTKATVDFTQVLVQEFILIAKLLFGPKIPPSDAIRNPAAPVEQVPISAPVPSLTSAPTPPGTRTLNIPSPVDPTNVQTAPGAEGRPPEPDTLSKNGPPGSSNCPDSDGRDDGLPSAAQQRAAEAARQNALNGRQNAAGRAHADTDFSAMLNPGVQRWPALQQWQEWQYQMEVIIGARTAHLENVNAFSVDYVTLLETGQMSYTQCGGDPACVQASDAHAAELMNYRSNHPFGAPTDVVGWEAAAEGVGEDVAIALA